MNTYKICLIGDAQVGKSTLLHRFTNGNFIEKYQPTMGVDVAPVKHNDVCLNIWDCSGSFRGLKDGYYVQAHGAIFMFDLTNKDSFKNLGKWLVSFLRVAGDCPVVICGTKCDLEKKQVSTQDIQQFLYHDLSRLLNQHKLCANKVKYYDISSKSNYNFDKPFTFLVETLTQ